MKFCRFFLFLFFFLEIGVGSISLLDLWIFIFFRKGKCFDRDERDEEFAEFLFGSLRSFFEKEKKNCELCSFVREKGMYRVCINQCMIL